MLIWIDRIFTFYTILIFVRILGSWFPEWQDSKIMRFVAFYTDPYLNFFRRFVPPLGMLDFSPVVALLALQLMEALVIAVLYR